MAEKMSDNQELSFVKPYTSTAYIKFLIYSFPEKLDLSTFIEMIRSQELNIRCTSTVFL